MGRIRLLADMARQIETELRSLDPPAEDAVAIEEHFVRPWSEHARFLAAMADARIPRWLGPSGTRRFLAEAPGAPQDREEDIDFCNAYGLGEPDAEPTWDDRARRASEGRFRSARRNPSPDVRVRPHRP